MKQSGASGQNQHQSLNQALKVQEHNHGARQYHETSVTPNKEDVDQGSLNSEQETKQIVIRCQGSGAWRLRLRKSWAMLRGHVCRPLFCMFPHSLKLKGHESIQGVIE